jgi:hypothetical protein
MDGNVMDDEINAPNNWKDLQIVDSWSLYVSDFSVEIFNLKKK